MDEEWSAIERIPDMLANGRHGGSEDGRPLFCPILLQQACQKGLLGSPTCSNVDLVDSETDNATTCNWLWLEIISSKFHRPVGIRAHFYLGTCVTFSNLYGLLVTVADVTLSCFLGEMDNLPPRVICTCSLCRAEIVTNDFGQRQPGKRVAESTRKYHRRQDQGSTGPSTLPIPPTGPLPQPANPAFAPVMLQQTARRAANEGGNRIDAVRESLFITHLPENTFFAGITPPPKEPTMTTITAVADPVVDRLKPMWDGRLIKTYRHPQGIQRRAALLARIGDLLAIRKALGFAGVASHHFCSFCKLLYADKDDLNYLSWEERKGPEVLSAAMEWKEATTKSQRKEIFKRHGVRWSSLHGLPYGDPVRHTLLATSTHPLDTLAGLNLGEDVLEDEMETLYEESRSYEDTPSHITRMHSEASMLLPDEQDSDNGDVDFQPDSDSDSEEGEEDDLSWEATCTFTAGELSRIRACLSDVKPSRKEDPSGAGLKIVPVDVYNAILAYLNAVSRSLQFRHAQAIPHPNNALVLPRAAVPVFHFKHKGRDYSTIDMHPGNSSVHFASKESGPDSGHIESMWRYKLDVGLSRTFIVLSLHQPLSPQDAQHNPYQLRPGFLANVVYARNSDNHHLMILEQDDIIGHVAYYARPPGTFGISGATTVLINSLHRNRD
ncbi:hypothetical protein BDZ97DRAFT_1766045 [Flammula alnicola]|nr:hypothetical protein BDZ97DRAFT_1766045 [Flammula alnicola]